MEKLNLTGKSKHSTDDALRGLSALFVDQEKIFIDNGAIHAKSQLERDLTFVKSPEILENPRTIWVFWITLRRFEGGVQGFHGAMPFTILVDHEKRAYKSLSEQVNKMDKAVKGNVDLSGVPEDIRRNVIAFLRNLRQDLWDNASDTFRSAFE